MIVFDFRISMAIILYDPVLILTYWSCIGNILVLIEDDQKWSIAEITTDYDWE